MADLIAAGLIPVGGGCGGTQEIVMGHFRYVFPSTIYAHSAVTVGFNAFEMD